MSEININTETQWPEVIMPITPKGATDMSLELDMSKHFLAGASLDYNSWHEVKWMTEIPVKECSASLAGDLNIHVDEVTMLKTGMGTHCDVFDLTDNAQLALALASTGVVSRIGTTLMRDDIISGVLDAILPGQSGANVRNFIKASNHLVTYDRLLEATSKAVKDAGIDALPGNSLVRRYIVLSVAELIAKALSPFVTIAKSRPISVMRKVDYLWPTKTDYLLMIAGTAIHQVLDTLDADVACVKPATQGSSFAVVSTTTREIFASLGRGLYHAARQETSLDQATSAVSWFIQSPRSPGFPEELKTNQDLLTLAANATFVRYCLNNGRPSLTLRPGLWEQALRDTLGALKDPAYCHTMRLSDFQSCCGHSRILDRKGKIRAVLFWTNLPGSSESLVFQDAQIEKTLGIGEVFPYNTINQAVKSMIGKVQQLTGQDFAHNVRMVIENVMNTPKAQEQLALMSKREGDACAQAPLFVRFSADKDALWYYACSLVRQVTPTMSDEGSLTNIDFIFNIEGNNVDLPFHEFRGRMRSSDPRSVLFAYDDADAKNLLPVVTDGLPLKDRDKLILLDSIPTFRAFNETPIQWVLETPSAGKFTIKSENFADLLDFTRFWFGLRLTSSARTALLLSTYDKVLETIQSWVQDDTNTDILIASLMSHIVKDMVADTPVALDVQTGIARRLILNCTDDRRRSFIETDLNRASFDSKFAHVVGGEILRQTGLASTNLVNRWMDTIDKANWHNRAAYIAKPNRLRLLNTGTV